MSSGCWRAPRMLPRCRAVRDQRMLRLAEAGQPRAGSPAALPAGSGWSAEALLPTPSPSSHPGWEQKKCKKEKVAWKERKKKKEAKAKEGIWAAGEEGRRLPEDPTELASVRISTAVPKAQNKHGGNACSLQTRATLSLLSRAPSAACQAPRRAGVGTGCVAVSASPGPFQVAPSGSQSTPDKSQFCFYFSGGK